MKKAIAKIMFPLLLAITPSATADEHSKGLYMTSWVAGSSKYYEIVESMKETELNTLVIDLKDASGHIAFNIDNPLIDSVGAEERRIRASRLEEIMDYCEENNIYTIARIVVGKDPFLAKYDYSRNAINIDSVMKPTKWVDLASPVVQEYNLIVAKEAEKLGFDEINFDYMRYPDPIEVKNPYYPFKANNPAAEGVKDFLKKADEKIDIKISVDVYAYTVWGTMKNHLDESYNRIGQVIELIGEHVDYIYPMLYPSHFRNGDRENIQKPYLPESVEYAIISEGCRKAKKRLEAYKDSTTKIVPWIQGFKMKDEFNENYINNQIRGAEDRNINGYLIWSPSNHYEISIKAIKSKNEKETQ